MAAKCLSKSRRERVRQLHRRQFDTGRAVTRRADSAAEVRDGFNILVDLHQRRRESLGESGCFSDPAFGSFLSEAALRFSDLGQLRLQWVELEGRPVAAQIDFAGAETSYHYQSGIDPTIPRERPGWLGTSAALKFAIEDGFTHFDFLRGDEPYKSHWRAEPVETFNIRVAGDSTSSRLRHEMWTIQQRLKSWVKSRFRRV
jgi:CelD/BcsL family acetyltransferase involved in cellulose biosynthesis